MGVNFCSILNFFENFSPEFVFELGAVQGLSVLFACIESGDHVRVLRLYTTNTLDTL